MTLPGAGGRYSGTVTRTDSVGDVVRAVAGLLDVPPERVQLRTFSGIAGESERAVPVAVSAGGAGGRGIKVSVEQADLWGADIRAVVLEEQSHSAHGDDRDDGPAGAGALSSRSGTPPPRGREQGPHAGASQYGSQGKDGSTSRSSHRSPDAAKPPPGSVAMPSTRPGDAGGSSSSPPSS